MPEYSGAPWRSRFLRGPKLALELESRSDYTALDDLAEIRLGLKSGNDGFFFLRATGARARGQRIAVRGLGGWSGELRRQDVRPGIRTPRDLDTASGRLAAVPSSASGRYAGSTYYFRPADGRLDSVAREYIEYGEARRVHQGELVSANAEEGAWYRQARSLIASRWALSYNSGYDYGAVDNRIRAVLNGRFVGAEPREGVDAEALGAVLNSTLVTVARLLEGVATGNEGAFDVGPPAARVMRVPHVVHMHEAALASLAALMDEVRRAGTLPPAPDASGTVDDLRRRLDTGVLVALGETPGSAAVLLDRLYRSYGRWRAAVESVEDQMQVNRRALARRGGTRQEPAETRAGRTVWEEMAPSQAHAAWSLTQVEVEIHDLRLGVTEDSGQGVLFEHASAISADGVAVDLGDASRLRFAEHLHAMGWPGPIPIPVDPEDCTRIREELAAAVALFREDATRRARAYVGDNMVTEVVRIAERLWLSRSWAAIKEALEARRLVEGDGAGSLFGPPGVTLI